MKRIFAISLLVIAIAGITFVMIYTYPEDVKVSIDGILYRLGADNDEETKEVTLIIDGTVDRRLNGDQFFTGLIDIEGMHIPVPKESRTFEQVPFNRNSMPMVYTFFNNNKPYGYSIGWLYTNRNRTQFSLTVQESIEGYENRKSWNGEDGLMIAAPAATREEALKVTNEVMTTFKPEAGYK